MRADVAVPVQLPRPTRLRRRAYQGVAALTGAFFVVAAGAVYLTTSWFLPDEHPVAGVGLGVRMTLLAGVAALATVRDPERAIAPAQQVVLVMVAGLVTTLLTAPGNPNAVVDAVSLGVPTLALLLLHPHPRALTSLRGADRPMLTAAVVGAVPLLAYAMVMGAAQLGAGPSDPVVADGVTRYAGLSGTAIGLALGALLAATRSTGWRVCAWTSGLGLALLGLASALFPSAAGTVGRPGGLAAILLGLIFLGLAERRARREAA